MAIEIRRVVKVGFEQFHDEATSKLANLDAVVEEKVATYRETVIAEMNDDRLRLQNIVEMCTEEKEFEVPEVEETTMEQTEEYMGE